MRTTTDTGELAAIHDPDIHTGLVTNSPTRDATDAEHDVLRHAYGAANRMLKREREHNLHMGKSLEARTNQWLAAEHRADDIKWVAAGLAVLCVLLATALLVAWLA